MSCSTRLVSARRFQVCCSCPSCCLWWQVLCRPILGPRSPCWTTCLRRWYCVDVKANKVVKVVKLLWAASLPSGLFFCLLLALLLCLSWLPLPLLCLLCLFFLSSWPPLPSLLGLFFTFLSCRFFFDFQFVMFLFFSTITPRHHSASLSFDTVWSRIAWKFWISPLSSWVMDFWISSLLGLVITLLCFLFWSITSNMYPDDFNISSSELCNLVWRFSGMVGK